MPKCQSCRKQESINAVQNLVKYIITLVYVFVAVKCLLQYSAHIKHPVNVDVGLKKKRPKTSIMGRWGKQSGQ